MVLLQSIFLTMLTLCVIAVILYFTVSNYIGVKNLKKRFEGDDATTTNRISSVVDGVNYNDEKLHIATTILANDIDSIRSSIKSLEAGQTRLLSDISSLESQIETIHAE